LINDAYDCLDFQLSISHIQAMCYIMYYKNHPYCYDTTDFDFSNMESTQYNHCVPCLNLEDY